MKKNIREKLFILLLFLGIVDITRGQNFEPSTQAKGYLDNKNISVDYSTGILHYTIPLFNIHTGNYHLPISLQYSSRGVKVDAPIGTCGYNWNLNAGGVVTRTVRGGIADEQNKGMEGPSSIIPSKNPKPPTYSYVEEVYDEEHDIFTAIFNGKSVNFIIRKNTLPRESDFIVEPLEKTNVRIEHGPVTQDELGYLIHDWTLTDVDGTRYIYKQKEWVFNAVAEGLATRNVENEKYVSSWFLTEIDIPNADNIYFEYENPEDCSHYESNSTYEGEYIWNNNETIFHYQIPRKEVSWDLRVFNMEIPNYLSRIHAALDDYIFQEEINNIYAYYDKAFMDFFQDPAYNMDLEKIKFHKSLQSSIFELYDIKHASQNLIDLLNIYVDEFEDCYEAMDIIKETKNALLQAYSGFWEYRTISIPLIQRLVVQTPILELISCRDKTIKFSYGQAKNVKYSPNYFHRLVNIILTNTVYNFTEFYTLEYTSSNNLYKINHNGSDGQTIDWQKFSYYHEGFNKRYDKWGYSSNVIPAPHALNQNGHIGEIDNVYSKFNSLQTIAFSSGNNITIDYESNKKNKGGSIELYGGIRLKSLVSTNTDRIKDSISYKYPQEGLLVYPEVTNVEFVEYAKSGRDVLKDTIVKSYVDYKGGAFLNTGNNGLYYPYVEEHIVGKGWNTYLFSVPVSSGEYDETYPFWLSGLLLGKAIYDESGNLIYLQKNKYLSDATGYVLNVDANKWIEDSPTFLKYSKRLFEMKSHNYYFDYFDMADFYHQHRSVSIFSDPKTGYQVEYPSEYLFEYNFMPYQDIQEFRGYTLHYGGKTFLSNQKEYFFITPVTSLPSISHLTESLPVGDRREQEIRYVYDNPNFSEVPSHIEKLSSKGEKKIQFIQTALDFQKGVDPVIDTMKSRNMVAQVIKTQSGILKPGSNRYYIVNEKVNVYDLVSANDGKNQILLKKRMSSRQFNDKLKDMGIFSFETNLYTFLPGDYREEESYKYRLKNRILLAEQMKSLARNTVIKYNEANSSPVFKAENISSESVDARDDGLYRDLNTNNTIGHYWNDYYNVALFDHIYNNEKNELIQYNSYFSSTSLNNLMEFARNIYELNDINTHVSELVKFSTIDSLRDNFLVSYPFYDECYLFCESMMNFIAMRNFEYEHFRNAIKYRTDYQFNKYMLSAIPSESSYRVTLLVKPAATTMSLGYRVKKGSTSVTLNTPSVNVSVGKWQLVYFDINLGNLAGITGLEVDIPFSLETLSSVLHPRDLDYEMQSYDLMNRLLSKFDGNGHLERYEYDTAGRIIRIIDKNNNVIEERQYNLLK